MEIKEIKKYWDSNIKKLEKITKDQSCFECGVFYTEAFLLCSIFDLLDVDLILESGTAWGQSTELISRFLGKKIKTVDFDSYYNQYENTKKRLSIYQNIECIKGDSNIILEDIVKNNTDKKIGIFIDGPKGNQAITLGRKLMIYDNVKCVGYHDMFSPPKKSPYFCINTKNFINDDYFYLNNKIFDEIPAMKKYKPDGPGVFVEVK